KVTDPSLIIYHPVRVVEGATIVTNGDQTDTLADAFRAGTGFVRALRTRTFEPDGPNYTPRISGMVRPDGSYRLSILKSAEGDPASCQRFFFEYDAPLPGQGHFISTYDGDGDPLPSFTGEPRPVSLAAPSAAALSREVWESLDGENKVSLYVSYLDLETGARESVITNKHQEV
ncbi:MAG TPA: inosine monophosphate cyclohydrolase, partial [Candidatus Galloscillospira excrementavium]|nr:inosine monophosphate cyclohydrolase [Candidatus Galloscillospira excrementavium]